MRKVAFIAIIGLSLGMGLPYALDGQWWGSLACIMAGVLWFYPSSFFVKQRSSLSLSIFAVIGALAVFFGQSHLWVLTNFVLLLLVWDLDHYTRVYQEFELDQTNGKTASDLFSAHLKRLGVIAGAGWCLGVAALNMQFQINFAVALILIFLMIIGLRQAARYIVSIER